MKKIWDFLFHKHTFDPKGWQEIVGYNFITLDGRVVKKEFSYTNTCNTCGNLITKTVRV